MSRRNYNSGQGSGQANSGSSILYLGLVPFDWDENNLRSLVCGTGIVVDVRLGFDYSGKNKGFCFIEYQSNADALNGMRLLGQVVIHQGGRTKKLRVELSKEGLRSNTSQSKTPLQLNRNYLPQNVQLPPEMMNDGMGTPQFYNQQQASNASPRNQMNPMGQGMNQSMSQGMNQNVNPSMNQGMNPGMSQVMNQANQGLNLPAPTQLPFTTPDKISENLSHIPPAQLLDVIRNLKPVLSGPYANRAAEVFQLSPYLASASAQALLLMGFVDTEVINDAMKTPAFETTPTPQMSNPLPVPYQQTMNQPYNRNNMTNMPAPAAPVPGSKWPFLPIGTQNKLAMMPLDQADLIAQVLTIPVEQIPSLDPEKQAMVSSLRAQYL